MEKRDCLRTVITKLQDRLGLYAVKVSELDSIEECEDALVKIVRTYHERQSTKIKNLADFTVAKVNSLEGRIEELKSMVEELDGMVESKNRRKWF